MRNKSPDASEFWKQPIPALLRALPGRLSPKARLTMLVFWDDAGRMSGPSEINVPAVQRATGLSWGAQQNAIRELRKAGLLTESRRYQFDRGYVWIRFVKSPVRAPLEERA